MTGLQGHEKEFMKICLVAPPGGHLTQLLNLNRAFDGYSSFYITYADERTAGLRGAYLLPNIWKKPRSIFFLVSSILRVLLKEKPDVVISTGGEIALIAFVLAKAIGAKTIFIESLARVSSKSVTGTILYPISTVFLVQSLALLPKYGQRAKYWGSLV